MNDVMTPGCLVFANCVVAAMVLAAVVWLVARGARALLRLPRQALAVFFSLAAVAMLSAQKQGGQQHGEPPPRMVPSAPTVVPAAVDDEGPWMPTNLAAVTNLCFWGIAKETNSVSLGLAWPTGTSFADERIDLYGHWMLATNGWAHLAQVDVGDANSNAVVSLPFASFTTNAM